MRPKILKNLGVLLIILLFEAKVNAQAPVAAFSADDSLTCIGINVNFTDLSTGGVGPLTWLWDFGDGSTSTIQNPSHAWSTGGSKVVTLLVTDSLSNTSTTTDTIDVIEAIIPAASIRICSPASSTTVIATAPIYTGVTGSWFAGGTAIIADPLNDTTIVSNLSNGLNLVFWVVSDGFCSDADQIALYVDVPVVANAGPDLQVCSSVATATMAANNPAPGTGLWTTTSSATITTPTSRNTTITGLNVAGNYDFYWTITYGACVTVDSMRIVVTNYIAANAGADQNVCVSPGTATLSGNTPAAGSVSWTTTGTATIISPASPTTNVSGLTAAGVQTWKSLPAFAVTTEFIVTIKVSLLIHAPLVMVYIKVCVPAVVTPLT